jgi:sugar phosphate isomerase/epimerase
MTRLLWNRRRFLAHTLSATGLFALNRQLATAAPAADKRFPIITFSKPFQSLNFADTADLLAEVGYDGIECPVRDKGQILPERVEDELPKLHEALKARQLDLTLITTDVGGVTPLNEKVLRTAARLGVKRYRTTTFHYDLAKPIAPQIANLKPALRDLAALNKELGIKAGLQNHSGRDYVGAPIWDLFEIVKDIDPAHLGVCFDIGHATAEGGSSWPIEAHLMEPFFTCVYVKDFSWKKNEKGWGADWGPLGEGMVDPKFFTWLRGSSYRGPISQHCEYLKGGGAKQRAQMKKDLTLLRGWLGA